MPELQAPENVTATPTSGCQIVVKWSRPTGEGQDRLAYFYRLYCREKGLFSLYVPIFTHQMPSISPIFPSIQPALQSLLAIYMS